MKEGASFPAYREVTVPLVQIEAYLYLNVAVTELLSRLSLEAPKTLRANSSIDSIL